MTDPTGTEGTDAAPARDPTSPPDRSGYAHALILSGFLGLAAGLTLELLRLLALDPLVGPDEVATWVAPARSALVVASLAAVVYAWTVDGCFDAWRDVATACVLVSQWGLPLGLFLDATRGGLASPYGYLVLVCAALQAVVAAGFAVAYVAPVLGRFRER